MAEQTPPQSSTENLPTPSNPFPGSLTPGWNDPPPVQYNPLSASSSSGRTKLNKRVPFPLQQGPGVMSADVSKPTAIVGPLMNQSVNEQQHIAVVHPMPSMGTAPSAQIPLSFSIQQTAGIVPCPHPPTTHLSMCTTLKERIGGVDSNIPTVLVPAVPRQTTTATIVTATTSTDVIHSNETNASSIYHL